MPCCVTDSISTITKLKEFWKSVYAFKSYAHLKGQILKYFCHVGAHFEKLPICSHFTVHYFCNSLQKIIQLLNFFNGTINLIFIKKSKKMNNLNQKKKHTKLWPTHSSLCLKMFKCKCLKIWFFGREKTGFSYFSKNSKINFLAVFY